MKRMSWYVRPKSMVTDHPRSPLDPRPRRRQERYAHRGRRGAIRTDAQGVTAHERHRRVVIVVDEAHLLKPDQLEELRLLTNSDMDSKSPFAGILIGQPMLTRQLRLGVFAALDQRIATRFHIPPMDLGDATAYLRHHLGLAGRSDQLLADDASVRLHRLSHGVPRALNNAAAADGKDIVDDACAKKAVAELTRE